MTAPGWYPDQNGGSGKKYWDGQAWHDAIPAAPILGVPPGPMATPGQAKGDSKPSRLPSIPVILLIGIPVIMVSGWFGNKLADGVGAISRGTPGPSISAPSLPIPNIAIPGLPTPIQSQDAAFNGTLQIAFQTFQLNGALTNSIAAVSVGNPQQFPDGLSPLSSGTLYGVEVRFISVSGTVPVHPSYFAARTDGSANAPSTYADVEGLLPDTELPEGQRLRGWVVFDVPRGNTIKEVVLEEPAGGQLGRWLVK